MKGYNVIGIMSGSSLDGLDMAYCHFSNPNGHWKYHFKETFTFPFPVPLREQLKVSRELDGQSLHQLDIDLGMWIGEKVHHFLKDHKEKPDLISSHGHTVFHNPGKYLSSTIGNAHMIAGISGIPVITDFRQADVAKKGQGAPLAPIGDLHLFREYDACLNLGGIANISLKTEKEILAWDVVPCNQVLNSLAWRLGFPYDKDGELARSGNLISNWRVYFDNLPYFSKRPPKSISNEWVQKYFLSDLPKNSRDALYTFTHFIVDAIVSSLKDYSPETILLSGGGAKNSYLVQLIREKVKQEVIVPKSEIIDFKEALIFAFLGVLRSREEVNVLSSVTGATSDSVAGTIYLP